MKLNWVEKIGIATIAFIIIMAIAKSCSGQGQVYQYGGTMNYYIEPNQKLVHITWKDNNLWYLTRPMTEGDVAETYKFQESDSLGIMEGTVFIYEQKMNEEEYENWENQVDLSYDYYREGNIQDGKEICISYDKETNLYWKIRDYFINEDGSLTPSPAPLVP